MEEEGRDGKGREEAEGEEDWERGGRARLGYFPVPLALLPPPLRVPSYATGLGIIPSIAGDVLYILLHYRKLNGFQWGGGVPTDFKTSGFASGYNSCRSVFVSRKGVL